MVALEDIEKNFTKVFANHASWSDGLEREASNYVPLDSFALDKTRQYQQQFADLYFLRLTKIKPAVEEVALAAWDGTVIGGEQAKKVERVLDVRQGELCWVAGTVYVDMPLKPNIMDDVAKDRWISAPSTVDRYFAGDERDAVMLEDDSGRIRLVGERLKRFILVTGCIMAVMGTENAAGEFEVIDLKFPDLAPQPDRWSLSPSRAAGSSSSSSNKKIAIVSGLEFSGTDSSYAMELNLLLEYLLGEACEPSGQKEVAKISRLIVAGNSIAPERKEDAAAVHLTGSTTTEKRKLPSHGKKYGYDASSYNPLPAQLLDGFLNELLPSMPVTLLPGASDPANASYPQQPIHTAILPQSRAYVSVPGAKEPGWLDAATNPWEAEVEGWRLLGTGGQNLDDIFKYVDSHDRLGMMEATCRWRISAPTAPDTLWAYPFQEDEPFVMKTCPHLYFVGCQPKFGTKVIHGQDGQEVRLITVPSFAATREVVLVDTETLEVSLVKLTA